MTSTKHKHKTSCVDINDINDSPSYFIASDKVSICLKILKYCQTNLFCVLLQQLLCSYLTCCSCHFSNSPVSSGACYSGFADLQEITSGLFLNAFLFILLIYFIHLFSFTCYFPFYCFLC